MQHFRFLERERERVVVVLEEILFFSLHTKIVITELRDIAANLPKNLFQTRIIFFLLYIFFENKPIVKIENYVSKCVV